MSTLNFVTIPSKKLAQGISSLDMSFYLNNILSFDGENDVLPADLGSIHFVCFRNETGTRVELMEIDPSTISTGPVTIVRRGLSYYGGLTDSADVRKFDWAANETIVQLGTDVPQIFEWLKAAAIAPTVDVGTTTTGAPGTSASVLNSGTNIAAVFDFTIPAGSVIHSTINIPNNSVGVDGDWAFSTSSTSNVYYKSGGAWALVNSNKGATGASIISGAFVGDDLVFTKDDASTVTIVGALTDFRVGNTVGNTTGNTVGNTAGNTAGNTIGNTLNNTAGNTLNNTDGNTVGNTIGNTDGNTVGNTLNNTDGNTLNNTDGNTVGNTIGNTLGNTVGNTDGNTVGNDLNNTAGNTVGNTIGNTIGNTLNNTDGNTVGNTVGNDLNNTAGNTVGNTIGNTLNNTDGNTVGNTTGNTVGNTAGNTVGTAQWKGLWSAGSYLLNDAVSYNGTSYVANTNTSQTPPGTDWTVMAQKGDPGAGSGDVNGPASSVTDNFASFTDTTGKAIKDSGKKASDFQAALGFTPENVANKQSDLTASATKYPTVDAVNTGLSTKQPTGSYEVTTNKATTFGTINDTLYPTVKAVNDAIVSAVAGLLDYRGAYNASTNLFPATGGSGVAGAILKGDFWVCSVAGTLGGTAVTPGDLIIALQDTPAQTAANWDLVEHDLGYAPEDVANKKTTMTGNESSNTFYLTAKAIYDWAIGLFWTNSSTNTGTNKTLNSNTNYIDADATHQKVFLNLGRAGVIGDVVYVGAWNVANGCSEVSLARANSTTTLPVAGVLESAGADGTVQSMRVEGILTNVNTNAWSVGTRLYVSAATAGALTSTRPTTPNFDQAVATVALQNATTGVLDVIRTAYVGTMAYEDTATYLAKTGGTMTGKTVSAGSSEVGKTYTPASGSQTVALDCAVNNMHIVTGNASGTAITFTVANATNSQVFTVSILQGAVVSTIAGWFATIRWAGGSAPTLTATVGKRDTFIFIRTGTDTYDGFVVGQNC